MKHLYFITTVFFVIITTGCGGKDEEVKTGSSSLNTPVNTAKTDAPVTNSNVSVNPPENNTITNSSTPITINPQTVSATATGLNPAHGQPGHRCDIAVGAPLNSAPNPGTTTTPTLTNNQSPVNIAPPIVNTSPKINSTPTNQPVAAGMNPAHGEPGHRCDIAVGAPLNSPKQTTTTPAINTNAAPTMTPSIVNTSPKINTTPAKQTVVAAGMNPAHGEPGHRCDIAVGAPLNSPINPNYTPPGNKQEIPVKKDN